MEHVLNHRTSVRRLYRPAVTATLIWVLATTLALPAHAQLRTTKPAKGPRAVAVIRWQPNAQGKAVPRLLPVFILENGKFYDATLFRATPRPMALEPGVVYEAQDKGDLLGYFTVQNASRNATTRQWVGLGEWQSSTRSSTELELRNRPQTAEVVKDGRATSPIFTEPVDDRDIKKKSTVYDEEGREIPAGQEPEEDAPPTLKRKQGDIERQPRVAPPKKESPVPTNADDDPERPRLKRGTKSPGGTGESGTAAAGTAPPRTTAAETPAAPENRATKNADDDPNRPILRRGGASQQKTGTSETEQTAGGTVPGRVQARGEVTVAIGKPASGFATRTFEAVAVSDAEETLLRQDYRFRWNESEREELTAKMQALAQQEIMRFLQTPGLKSTAASGRTAGLSGGRVSNPARKSTSRPGTRRASVPATLALADVQLAGLDLDGNNSAELVFTARGELGARSLFVTLVARTDVNGNPRKLFAVVTTNDRLDVAPRLELVDAVDADGDRRAELLFRRMRENSADFVLYRVGADMLTELFHGGHAE